MYILILNRTSICGLQLVFIVKQIISYYMSTRTFCLSWCYLVVILLISCYWLILKYIKHISKTGSHINTHNYQNVFSLKKSAHLEYVIASNYIEKIIRNSLGVHFAHNAKLLKIVTIPGQTYIQFQTYDKIFTTLPNILRDNFIITGNKSSCAQSFPHPKIVYELCASIILPPRFSVNHLFCEFVPNRK